MADKTELLKLSLPYYSDNADINVINENMRIIDNLAIDVRDSIKSHKEKKELDHPDKSVKYKHLDDDAVKTRVLADESVTSSKLAASSVQSDHIKDGGVTSEKLADVVRAGTVNGITFNSKGQIEAAENIVVDCYTKAKTDELLEVIRGEVHGNENGGWTKLANGLIIQWGIINGIDSIANDRVPGTYSFPIAFENKPFIVVATTVHNMSKWDESVLYTKIKDKTAFWIIRDAIDGTPVLPAYWYAIGI